MSGYDASPPSSSYKPNPPAPYNKGYDQPQAYEAQPPAFGYEPPTAAVHDFQPTCKFVGLVNFIFV